MPLSTFTFKNFESQVRAETGATDYANPNTTSIMRWTNIALKKIARLTYPIDMPWGRNVIGPTKTVSVGLLNDPGDGGSFTASTKVFSGLTGVTAIYLGGVVFWVDQSNSRAHWGRIDEWTSTTLTISATAGTGALADVASANLFLIAKPNPWYYTGGNIGASVAVWMDLVKFVDDTLGHGARLDEHTFSSFTSNPNYDNSVVWQPAGDAIFVGKGTDQSGAYGTWSLTVDEAPATITAGTDSIDIRPEHLSILKDEVVRWVLNYLGNTERVKEIGNPLQELEVAFTQHAKERVVRQLRADQKLRRM